jgi:hypothetical protein
MLSPPGQEMNDYESDKEIACVRKCVKLIMAVIVSNNSSKTIITLKNLILIGASRFVKKGWLYISAIFNFTTMEPGRSMAPNMPNASLVYSTTATLNVKLCAPLKSLRKQESITS